MSNFIYRILLSLFCFTFTAVSSFAGVVTGKVADEKGISLSGVNLTIEGTTWGTASDLEGLYRIEYISAGNYLLKAAYLGYQSHIKSIRVSEDGTIEVNFSLKPDTIRLEELTVEVERENSQITLDELDRREILSSEDIQKASSNGGVLSALESQTGINTRPCALCGSAGVGMQGLDPSYTETTVDGMPIISGVGALYGLDAVPVSNLSAVELTKGGGAMENSAGAIAGSVNLITEKPASGNSLKTKVSGSNTLSHAFDFNLNSDRLGSPASLTLNYSAEPRRIDYNHDQLTDSPQYRRLNLGLTNSLDLLKGNFSSRFRYYREHRFAGDIDWTKADRGSAAVYGRDIDSERGEISLSWKDNSLTWGKLEVESAGVLHSQKSWYGATEFNALQNLSFTQASLSRSWNEGNSSLVQTSFTYEEYEDNLNLSGKTDRTDIIAGIMFQHTYKPDKRWAAEGGLRLDDYNQYGIEPTFRGSVFFKPADNWRLRLTTGSGFRPVTIYSLDKAVHAGFDNVIVPAELNPERSWNVTSSISFTKVKPAGSIQLELSLYYTGFRDKAILAFADMAGSTTYSNAEDAYSRGIELRTIFNFPGGVKLIGNGTISEVRYQTDNGWQNEEMQNSYTGNFTLHKQWVEKAVTTDFSVNIFGPQYLPADRGRDKSPVFALANIGIAKSMGKFDLTLAIKNLTDWTQGDNPFIQSGNGSSFMDSAMIYGPLLGRTINIGVEYSGDL